MWMYLYTKQQSFWGQRYLGLGGSKESTRCVKEEPLGIAAHTCNSSILGQMDTGFEDSQGHCRACGEILYSYMDFPPYEKV